MAIQSFADSETEELFKLGKSVRFGNIAKVASRKLDMVHAAKVLLDLQKPPGNRLEKMEGNRAGQHSIRINDQWRVCFEWTQAGPANVEICDPH